MCPTTAASAAPATATSPGASRTRHTDRGCAFPDIEQEDEDANPLVRRPQHVRRADVAAAGYARIDAAEAPRDEQCEGNRAEKIGEQQNHPASMVRTRGS